MSDSESEKKSAKMLRDMKLEGTTDDGLAECQPVARVKDEYLDSPRRTPTPLAIPPRLKARSKSQSPVVKQGSEAPSPSSSTHEEVVGGDITLKMEPGKGPKLSRTASQKVVARTTPLFLHLPDSTEAAKETFVVLPECTYANKTIGTTDPALECDCGDEWDAIAKRNHACGEDSDCINRATKMECGGDCGCGPKCQNQRFLRKQYADVTVIKTEKKGFGLRANKDMMPGDFVFEYIGEVIGESTFRRRMHQYDEEGIKHFYFMSLSKDEFVDATKKGNLGRFCNHSCNPNCFVDKWVVKDKLRMGIFVERKVKAGEELVFNYNVDRYGANPQPCYCGEPICTGFIGGKTQSDNATNLSHATIEALGIDNGDGWDKAVPKKQRKKKANEDDEEYVNNLQPRELEEEDVPKVMAAMRQCTEKWIAVKLLSRIQQSENEKVGHRIIRMHGYETLKKTLTTCLTTWAKDFNVIKQILEILHKLPRITRNKIQESKIEETVKELKKCGDEQVEFSAANLLDAWSKLELAYRIPRVKKDPNANTPMQTVNHFERRERGRERSRSRSKSPVISAPKGPSASTAPSGPRGLNAPRGPASFTSAAGFAGAQRPAVRPRPFNPLPPGWFQATADNGSTYFYNSTGTTQWTRPSQPASQPPPPPPKSKTNTQLLQDIIAKITADPTPTSTSASNTPKAATDDHPEKRSKSEKWRSLPQEKQEKIYESTLSPHVMAVSSHYRKKFEKEELKRLSKEVAKKLVRGDYKSGRVKDPTAKLSSRHEKTVKHYVKEFLDKAVRKKDEREKQKPSGGVKLEGKDNTPATPQGEVMTAEAVGDEDLLDDKETATASYEASPADSSIELKRKREEEEESFGSPKKSRTGTDELPSAPPPPPPPPVEDMPDDLEQLEFTAVDETEAMSFIAVDKQVNMTKTAFAQANGHASPMQLATPPRNGSRSDEQKQEQE